MIDTRGHLLRLTSSVWVDAREVACVMKPRTENGETTVILKSGTAVALGRGSISVDAVVALVDEYTRTI